MLVLERLDHAIERGAPILAEVTGYGMSGDAYHIVQPAADGSGAASAMALAIDSAGLLTSDIDYINAHGTSTPMNDRIETQAIRTVFEQTAPPVSSIKALTGHLLGAAGAVEAVACVLAIQHQTLPPTWHLETPDPNCNLDYVAEAPRTAKVEHTLSNSLGFGGHNVSLVISKWGGESGAGS